MDLKTLFCACFIFQIYFTNASESDNVISPEQCILNKKSRISNAEKLKNQYISERGISIRHIWRGDWPYNLQDFNVDQSYQICRCFAKIYYNLNTELYKLEVNQNFQYTTKPVPLSWFGIEYNEDVLKCEFLSIRTFYLVASGKYYKEPYRVNVYVFELSDEESKSLGKRENPEKFVVNYPYGQFKVLYPKINLTAYFEKIKQRL